MNKEIKFRAAYDKRHPDPKNDLGIHGVDTVWILSGKHGAVQFVVSTGWQLPNVPDTRAMAVDLGYHSFKPMYEGHEPISESCPYTNGKPCFYDGSGLNAEHVFEILRREGSDGVWGYMEEYYKDTFGELA